VGKRLGNGRPLSGPERAPGTRRRRQFPEYGGYSLLSSSFSLRVIAIKWYTVQAAHNDSAMYVNVLKIESALIVVGIYCPEKFPICRGERVIVLRSTRHPANRACLTGKTNRSRPRVSHRTPGRVINAVEVSRWSVRDRGIYSKRSRPGIRRRYSVRPPVTGL